MSWFAKTIANSLRLDEEEDEQQDEQHYNNGADLKSQSTPTDSPSASASTHSPTARGVKEDISELTKSFSRQLWGVASFLAPPPSDPDHDAASDPNRNPADDEEEDVIAGIRSDFAEIGGRFKSGISKLSGHKTVSEITKIASTFLQLGSEQQRDLDGVIGVTEDVVAFARNVAMHPETWLDFPLPDDDPDSDEFDLTDAQQEHALAVEHLAPRLAALRMELCPGYMSDDNFWKIYFVLLHPKLNKMDAAILSTPQIMEARAMLTHELNRRSQEKKEPDSSARSNTPSKEEEEQHLFVPSNDQVESKPLQISAVEAAPSAVVSDVEMEKHPIESDVTKIIDKSVVKEESVNPIAEQPSSSSVNRFSYETYEDDADDWLKEDDNSEMVGPSGTSVHTGNEEDVSFSDLEEDDSDVQASYKKTRSGSDSSTKDSRDWVQLGRSSPNSDKDITSVESRHAGSDHSSARNSVTKDSNDWLNVDDIDVI